MLPELPNPMHAYEQARISSTLFDLSAYSKIEVAGEDHVTFLHSILSQDIIGMPPGTWREAALLSATSHVLAYMYVIKLKDRAVLIGMPNTTIKTIPLLEKFLITESVQIRDAQKDWSFFEIWGPESEALTKKISSESVFMTHQKDAVIPRTLMLAPSTLKLFDEKIYAASEIRETLRIENGILEFGKDFDETHMLSETRLEKKSASETKGCYPGQEVVAKIETYGRLNRSFVRLSWDQKKLPQKGSGLYSIPQNEEIGRLTSQTYSPFFKKALGLGWLKRGFFETPIELTIKSEIAIPAKTSKL